MIHIRDVRRKKVFQVMNKKSFIRLAGGGIIILWVVMMGLLIKKVHFDERKEFQGTHDKDGIVSVDTSEQEWMEIFLNGKKVGYSVRSVRHEGKDYLIWENLFLKLNLLGQASIIQTNTQSIVDNRFFLKEFRFRMESGIVSFTVSGMVKDKNLFLEIGEGKSKKSETIELSSKPVIGSGLAQFFKGRKLEPGQIYRFPVFDPSTLAQEEIVIKVAEREVLTIRRMDYDVFRLEAEMWGKPMTFWVDTNGFVLKEEGFMGLTLIRSSAAAATENIESGDDFYNLASIDAKRKLRKPEQLTKLELRVDGLDGLDFKTEVLNSGRQKYSNGMIEIKKESLPGKGSYSIPFDLDDGDIRAFTRPSLLIQSDEEIIIEKGREILGDTTDPVAATLKIVTWVYNRLEKRPMVTVPSAVDVLRSMMGDCNEHAVLTTALLRASGIPARVCVGLVYSRGKFFYHAWNECYVGKWVSLDATLNQVPADATHIKLVEGGLDKQVEIIRLIGKLKLEIIAYRR
jgi:hypothetical protein